jgi:SAM-dependent methyltransferase
MATHRDYVKVPMEKFFDRIEYKDVLEIGPGSHPFKEFFEKKGMKWYGTDICFPENIAGYFNNSMDDLKDVKDECFDYVFSCHSFEHCENPIKALKEFKRVLRKGGKLFIATPFHCEKQVLLGDKDHIFVLTHFQMQKLFEYVGFKVEDIFVSRVADRDQDWNLITIGVKE